MQAPNEFSQSDQASRCWAVVPAAGVGSRMRSDRPKQYLPLLGRVLLEHTVRSLLAESRIEAVVVALAAEDSYWAQTGLDGDARILCASGGSERCHSVLNSLRLLATRARDHDWVLVHDAARPCLRPGLLRHLIDTLYDDPVGGLLAMPVSDTVKQVDASGRVEATLDRERLWCAQTPQMFRFGLLSAALAAVVASGDIVTDDCAAIESAGYRPRLIEGSAANVKVTRAEDLALAEFYLRNIESAARSEVACVD